MIREQKVMSMPHSRYDGTVLPVYTVYDFHGMWYTHGKDWCVSRAWQVNGVWPWWMVVHEHARSMLPTRRVRAAAAAAQHAAHAHAGLLQW